jgi:DUF4097 and DUF4098 domain-containing protein YvlB
MRARIVPAAVAAALLSLTACDIEDFAGSRYERDFHFSYPLNAGAKITVETFNGSVEVSTWDQNTIDISGTKYGPTQAIADDLAVNVDHSPATVSVRVPRPSMRRGNLGARLVLKVPHEAVLDFVSTSNGAIRISGGAGPARLRTSNGSIRVLNIAGSVEAETSNGGITADLDRVDGPVRLDTSNGSVEVRLPGRIRDGVRVHTSNGGITIRVPEGLDARVSAHTSNAHVTSDFDVRMQGELNRHSLDGTIGNGGPLLDLSTSNGGIHLARL